MKIIPAGERSTETEIATAVEACCWTRPYGEANFAYLKFYLCDFIELTKQDKECQRHRLTDLKWHAVLRNIGAHANQPGNAIYEGWLVKLRGGGYAIPVSLITSLRRGGVDTGKCECGGTLRGVMEFDRLWTWCSQCTPVVKAIVNEIA